MNIYEIIIESKETLLKALDVLHDATCEEDDIRYDPVEGTLNFIINREFFEDSSKISVTRVLFLFHRIEFPITKSHFHLEGINFFNMQSRDKSLKTHRFNECKMKHNRFILYFCEVLEIELGFRSSITGYLKDTEFVEGKKGKFFQFGTKLPWSSNNKAG